MIKTIYLSMLIMLVCNVVIFASGGPINPDDPDAAAPIDGGLSLLIAAGVGYGVKKIRGKKHQKGNDVLNK